MPDQDDTPTYVFTKEAVLRSIRTLDAYRIHEHFGGYLAVLRGVKAREGKPARSSDINRFHRRYLQVMDAPEQKPFVRPFKAGRSKGKGLESVNKNAGAGSYALSSLRPDAAFLKVVTVQATGDGTTYALEDGHATRAREHLLGSRTLPVEALVAFLYRDYGLRLGERDVERVINLFRREFGMEAEAADEGAVFAELFDNDAAVLSESDLEVVPTEVAQVG